MKVIFLDIDGVLVTARTLKQRHGRDKVADNKCVYALNWITRLTGASIVVSSSWRFCGLNEMQRILDFWEVEARIVGMTPDLTRKDSTGIYHGIARGHEIQAYLDSSPEIERFVILDDECDMCHLEPFMVKTKFDCGLTEAEAQRAKEILCAATPVELRTNGETT